MPVWYHGRTALVGDVCQCLTLMAGQGASMTMAGAYVLAGELYASRGNYQRAFMRYQQIMQPDILVKQLEARKFVTSFVPRSNLGIVIRNYSMKLLALPFISKIYLKKFNINGIKFVNYAEKNNMHR